CRGGGTGQPPLFVGMVVGGRVGPEDDGVASLGERDDADVAFGRVGGQGGDHVAGLFVARGRFRRCDREIPQVVLHLAPRGGRPESGCAAAAATPTAPQ